MEIMWWSLPENVLNEVQAFVNAKYLPLFITKLGLISSIWLTAYAIWYIVNFSMCLSCKPYIRKRIDCEPRFVVMIPVYNDRSILKVINSILNMDYDNYFVVVADDSTDEFIVERLKRIKNKRFIYVRRDSRRGFKAGALNNALRLVENLNPKYVTILDADFEPPKDFLKRIAEIMENNDIDILQGYQRHLRGSDTLLGLVYRAAQAGAILNFMGRTCLDAFPIFYGSCGTFKFELFKLQKFVEESITEDLRLTIELFIKKNGKLRIVATNEVYANGSVPKNLKSLFKQQVRWSAGTLYDFLKTWDRLLTLDIPIRKKIDYLFQSLYFTQGLMVLLGSFCSITAWIFNLRLESVYPYLGVYLWLVGIITLLTAGAVMEGYKKRDFLKMFPTIFFLIYYVSLAHTWGTLLALYSYLKGKELGKWETTEKV